MTPHALGPFGIGMDFGPDEVVLAVRGDVDVLTAPALDATLGVIVNQCGSNLVVDVSQVSFMDASGLNVIAAVSARLKASSRALTIRAAPPQLRRILDITGLSERILLEDADPDVAVAVTPAELSADLTRVAIRPDNVVLDAALRLVTVLAGATVGGADGVSVTLERHGRMLTVASSNDTVLRMDVHQYETGEGPCLAAAAEGNWFHIESLSHEDRWPAFVPRAMEEGIASILSSPLITAERPVGALNIYSNTERAFGPHEQELAALFAEQASGILVDAGAEDIDMQLGKRISEGLLARGIIARAEGVLMARNHATAENAAATLHRDARAARVAVLQQAISVVESAAEYSESQV